MRSLSIGCVIGLVAWCAMGKDVAAQTSSTGAIAGVVRDTTGAVLPGVTVEAASPALIEKVRSVVTDAQGNYKILDLRPGTYAVTFTLTGFSTFRREGVDLSAGFTAPVNADMRVGALEETVTVSGASPVVDVQSTRTQQVLKAETLNALPVGIKSVMSLASLTLGAAVTRNSRNDVGGDQGEKSAHVSIHGSRSGDGKSTIDGMSFNVVNGNGGGEQRTYYLNSVLAQETVLDTGGVSAEVENNGVNVNVVPREGGNAISVYGSGTYVNDKFASKSVPQKYIDRGLPPTAGVKRIWDYGIGVGGPMAKDRLWFYSSNRWWGGESIAPGNYYNKSTDWRFYEPDLSRPAYAYSWFRDNGVRLTWQASSKQKVTGYMAVQDNCQCQQSVDGPNAPEAATDFPVDNAVLLQPTWTYAVTNRLLIQGGVSFLLQSLKWNKTQDDLMPGADDIGILEQSTGYRYNAMAGNANNYGTTGENNFNQRVAVSYVTGSHAFKTGMTTLQGQWDQDTPSVPPNELRYEFRSRTPVAVQQFASPFRFYLRIRALGLYAQDQWTIRRLTLNYGVRYDHFNGRSLADTIPGGRFTAPRDVPAREDLPNFHDVTPRLGGAYDLFGNGRTALRGSIGKYAQSEGNRITISVAPANAIVQNVTRTWNDVNGNYAPDCDLNTLTANGECGQVNNLNFGRPIPVINYADDARSGWGNRRYNWSATAAVQQELRPGVGIGVSYYRTWYGNFLATVNRAVTPADYDPYCITAPADPRLPGGGGNQICGLYDIKPEFFGRVDTIVERASKYGKQTEVFDGLEFALQARLREGGLLQGGFSTGRTAMDSCWANAYPNITPENISATIPKNDSYCHVATPWWSDRGSQVKLAAVYPLPWWGVQVSGTFKHLPGIPVRADLVATNAIVAPSLGRNLAAGANATTTIALIPFASPPEVTIGTEFEERLTQTDLRFTKVFRFRRSRMSGNLDIYNVFNSRVVQVVNNNYGPAWLRPGALLGPRTFRLSGEINF